MSSMKKLQDYAKERGITYRTAWNHYKKGLIPNAFMAENGRIYIQEIDQTLVNKAVIYARVSTNTQKADLVRQSQRLEQFAAARGLEIVGKYQEIGSGVNDDRKLLRQLFKNHNEWGVLIVEHKDRLTRFGFGYFTMFAELLGKEIIALNQAEDSTEGRRDDAFSILYPLIASEYGKRGAKNRTRKALDAAAEV